MVLVQNKQQPSLENASTFWNVAAMPATVQQMIPLGNIAMLKQDSTQQLTASDCNDAVLFDFISELRHKLDNHMNEFQSGKQFQWTRKHEHL